MMFIFERECIINSWITIANRMGNYRNWNVINSQAPTPEFKHCRLSPGRIVFACFIVCSTAEREEEQFINSDSFLLSSIQLN